LCGQPSPLRSSINTSISPVAAPVVELRQTLKERLLEKQLITPQRGASTDHPRPSIEPTPGRSRFYYPPLCRKFRSWRTSKRYFVHGFAGVQRPAASPPVRRHRRRNDRRHNRSEIGVDRFSEPSCRINLSGNPTFLAAQSGLEVAIVYTPGLPSNVSEGTPRRILAERRCFKSISICSKWKISGRTNGDRHRASEDFRAESKLI
jgi:hypothetical protein